MAAGLLHHCHTPAGHISTTSQNWHHPLSKNNKFWYCPELFLWARHPAVHPARQPHKCVAELIWARHHLHFRNVLCDRVHLWVQDNHSRVDGHERVYQWQGEHHANNYIQECVHHGSGEITSGYSTNYQRDSYLRGCCHRMRLWGTTLHFLCQGLCCRRTMPVLLLGAMQNELQVTNIDTLPIPFPHICHQLNKPGVSWKVDYSNDCIQHRLYRIFIKQSSGEWQLEHPTAGNEVPYLPHEALLSNHDQ